MDAHVAGRRIGVRQVYAFIEERDVDPETVADRFDLTVAGVYHALAYSHDHPREMNSLKAKRVETVEAFRESIERLDDVDPATR